MPSKLKINTNINKSTEKVLTSFIVTKIFARIILKLVQLRASLKTRSSLTPRNAERAPVGESPEKIAEIIISIIESMTIKASKRLNESRAYSLNPIPNSFITISTTNAQVKISFKIFAIFVDSASSGYFSMARTTVLPTIKTVMRNVNVQ